MRKQIVPALLLAFVFLAGCKGLAAKVLPPPTYDEACVPSDGRFLEWAQDLQDLTPIDQISADRDESYAQAMAEVEKRGLKIVPKGKVGSAQWDGFTTTFPDFILVGGSWDEKNNAAKAALLWHELVHKAQWDRLGREAFLARYITASGRWSIEVPAYRQSFRIQVLFGLNEDVIRENMADRAVSLYDKYLLGSSMPVCTQQTSVEIWSQDLAAGEPPEEGAWLMPWQEAA
jgi:hypothetical protein